MGSEDGSILESKENSNKGGKNNSTGGTFTVGDDALDRQYRGILSFDTSVLPDDAVITGVSVRVKKKSLVGTNPFSTHGKLNVEIGIPYFGTLTALQLNDWEAPAGGGSPASTVGKKPSSGWYSAAIPESFFGFVSMVGTTQFRLSFNKGDNDGRRADRQYRGILSFDTSVLPDDAAISGASLRIRKQGLVGSNPFSTHGKLNVEIGIPYFGTVTALQLNDWQATAGGGGPASTVGKKPCPPAGTRR